MLGEQLGHAALQEQEAWNVAQVAFLSPVRSGGAAIAWLLEFEPFLIEPAQMPIAMTAGALGTLGVVGLGEEFVDILRIAAPAAIERHASLPVNTSAGSASGRFVQDRIQIRRDLPQVNERLGGFLAETAGTLVLEGGDGGLDYLFQRLVLRDRPIRVKSAPTTRLANGSILAPTDLAQFTVNFEGRIINSQIDADGSVSFQVGDGWKRLDRPVQERLYLGTGGAEGGIELAGKPIPLAYGNCPNVTPTLVDRIKGIYQVHDGEVLNIRPRDMGIHLNIATEVDTFAALAALSQEGETDLPDISLGAAALCRAEGFFRVAGGAQITADVQGDGLYDGPKSFTNGVLFTSGVGFSAPGARTHRRFPAGMIYRILFSRLRVKDAELDIDQMLQFDQTHPFECGIFIPSSERLTGREVCTRIADSAGALVMRNKFGQITLRPLLPAEPTGQITITEANMAQRIERLPLPWGAPWPGIKVFYAPNWTVMTDAQISDELTDENPEKRTLMQDSSFLELTHAEMAALLPDREVLELKTVLRSEADALLVARRILDFYAGRWALWRVVVHGIPWRLDVLTTAMLQVPRFGFAGGQPMLVIGLEERPGEYETELTLLGNETVAAVPPTVVPPPEPIGVAELGKLAGAAAGTHTAPPGSGAGVGLLGALAGAAAGTHTAPSGSSLTWNGEGLTWNGDPLTWTP